MNATVIPFPAVHREGRIRYVAGILRRKHGRDAERYWHQVVLVMRRQMIAAQIDHDVIECEVRDFAEAVFARLPSQRPMGAA